ncbi:uncharacterized protein LOC113227722 isoform X2 [Hyposmocoma kahamanoa]|uniref:uncharacterized protein LOC113227722 isoform X2 n=1 Tax=Hyposmocoma kahamanoa TaxID=1477025 RepID=UPI000E6D6F24|nr:uncharacterized protein LOC113227722 isoform X2 [Hyposmocoma kahamanoa]
MESKLALLLIVGLLYAVHQTFADFNETKDKSNGEGENRNEDRGDDRDADVTEDEGNEVEAFDENDVVRDNMLKKGVTRRSHMNFQAQKDESCKVCVCSVEGKDEYCSRRPAMNVNECLRMADIMENYQKNVPFDVTKVLAYRIRRGQGGSAFKNQAVQSMSGIHCMPFVSEYSDCTEANQCSGCTRCTCNAQGNWLCRGVRECPAKSKFIGDTEMDSALKSLYNQLDKDKGNLLVPASQLSSPKSNEDLLLDANDEIEQKIVDLMNQPRAKRDAIKSPISIKLSKDKKNLNQTIKFYNTVDDMNENTLKHTNITGTLRASKIAANIYSSRRTSFQSNLNITNGTEDRPLQIEHNQQIYNQHIADNKIDETEHTEDPEVIIKKDIEIGIVTNQTQKEKDAELSKILVNELKSGKEMIGDENGPIMSNITFTPENDTLTAMAFIAGNLLNKLWSMQKDNSEEINMRELEKLKHEKINDLIELFKEPLTLRQELVLKNALEKLSQAMDQNLDPNNITMCENIAEVKRLLEDARNSSWQFPVHKSNTSKTIGCEHVHDVEDNKINGTIEAISRINKVLDLVKKYEAVNKHLNDLKRNIPNTDNKTAIKEITVPEVNNPTIKEVSSDDHDSLNLFGNLLSKITKLLLPNQIGKKLAKKITKQNIYTTDENKIKQKIKELYKYDLGNATLSIKDKLILDYLTKLESNPRILTEEMEPPQTRLSVEGDILLNLSEFFKIKSFVDLLKHLDSNKESTTEMYRSPLFSVVRSMEELTETYIETLTTVAPKGHKTAVDDQINEELVGDDPKTVEALIDETTVDQSITESAAKQNALEQEEREVEEEIATDQAITDISLTTMQNVKKFEDTKAKFKSHLKAILEDLVELQREYGINTKDGELRIADALPCIYNILQADKQLDGVIRKKNATTTIINPMQRIAAIFDSLKKELKEQTPKDNRRMSKIDLYKPRPKSALVWERFVKSMDDMEVTSLRRNEDIVPSKTYDELKEMIDNIETVDGSNTYKIIALYHEVPPADKLMLLQTLYLDVNKYLEVLPAIKSSIDILKDATTQQKTEIFNFVENAASKINLDNKIVFSLEMKNKTIPAMPVILNNFKSITSDEVKQDISQKIEVQRPSFSLNKYEKPYRTPPPENLNIQTSFKSKDNKKVQKPVSITREEVLNQLVKNRIELYLQAKKERGDKTALKYNIARNILQNIELGNYEIARELYKAFAQTSDIKPAVPVKPKQMQVPPKVKLENSRRQSIAEKVPLVDFQDLLGNSKKYKVLNRDFMLKQLLEFKNMKMVK